MFERIRKATISVGMYVNCQDHTDKGREFQGAKTKLQVALSLNFNRPNLDMQLSPTITHRELEIYYSAL